MVGLGLRGDWECVVEHDVMDGVFFCSVFLIVQVVCVKPVVKISYCGIFMLGGVVLLEYGVIESVNVGFLNIEVFHPVGVLWIVMSR